MRETPADDAVTLPASHDPLLGLSLGDWADRLPMPLVLEAVHPVNVAPEALALAAGGGPGHPGRPLALVVCDVWKPPGRYLAVLELVDAAQNVVTGSADDTRELISVVSAVVIVLYEEEDCVRDGSEIGRLPGADSAHTGPGPRTTGHRRGYQLCLKLSTWNVA